MDGDLMVKNVLTPSLPLIAHESPCLATNWCFPSLVPNETIASPFVGRFASWANWVEVACHIIDIPPPIPKSSQ